MTGTGMSGPRPGRRKDPYPATASPARDDLGDPVPVPRQVRRVVSLVPSLTESVAATRAGLLVGVTDWCTHPASLPGAERIGGTKNPDTARIAALRPDVVLANEEENRREDLAALRAAGVPVWVTRVRSLPEGLVSLNRMLRLACRLSRPGWLDAAVAAWQGTGTSAAAGVLALVPVWRRPWMVVGGDTFAGDLLARLGVVNVYAGHPERYPKIGLDELRSCGAGLVVLPDEPYPFSRDDGPEAFPGLPAALVSGRHLTWYGPSLAEAPALLRRQLAAAGPEGAP
jgi:ABC-type Fe3+-hydroxamate transport system substrate-binding protein